MAKHKVFSDGSNVATVEVVDSSLIFDTDDPFLREALGEIRTDGVVVVLRDGATKGDTIIDGVVVTPVDSPDFMPWLADYFADYGYNMRSVSGAKVRIKGL